MLVCNYTKERHTQSERKLANERVFIRVVSQLIDNKVHTCESFFKRHTETATHHARRSRKYQSARCWRSTFVCWSICMALYGEHINSTRVKEMIASFSFFFSHSERAMPRKLLATLVCKLAWRDVTQTSQATNKKADETWRRSRWKSLSSATFCEICLSFTVPFIRPLLNRLRCSTHFVNRWWIYVFSSVICQFSIRFIFFVS